MESLFANHKACLNYFKPTPRKLIDPFVGNEIDQVFKGFECERDIPGIQIFRKELAEGGCLHHVSVLLNLVPGSLDFEKFAFRARQRVRSKVRNRMRKSK